MHAIDGDAATGWGHVADAFRRNFDERNELGAGVTVYADSEIVVDLWGGTADSSLGIPWTREVPSIAFSCTKGISAICALLLVQRGMLDLEAPVAEYWPEFAQAGKGSMPVRWLLTHQCGLPFVDADLTFDDLAAYGPVVRALAAQEPHWEPGTHFAYHAVTFGHLVGELVERISGRPLGQFFAHEIAKPLALRSWIGFPPDEPLRPARVERVDVELPETIAGLLGPTGRWARAITLGSALPFHLIDAGSMDFNDREMLALPLGGTSLVTDARSLARVYAATVGEVDGVRLLSDDAIRTASQLQTRDVPYFGWPDELGHVRPMDFGLGFMAMENPLGPTSFGHGGAGGSLGFGDLDHGIGFGYVMNRMNAVEPDRRATSLVDAVRSCLG